MSKEYRLPENIKPQDLVRGIINASYWHWRNIDKIQHTEAIKYLNNLESIDNSNSSEALECLERIDNTLCLNNIKGKLEFGIDTEEHTDCDSVIGMTEELDTIKQALLKAQEQEKENTKYKQLEEQIGCPLDVVVKLLKNHIYYAEKPNHKGKVYQMNFPHISFVIKGGKASSMEYQDNSFIVGGTCYDFYNMKRQEFDGWDVHLKDYKKTWWLREDRSE